MGKREGKRKGKKEEKVFRESVSNFSLDFSAIGSAVSGETRSKVDPHYNSYAWVLVLWSFDKLREVGVFSYLIYSLDKSHSNGQGCLEAWMAMFSVLNDLD